MDRDTVLKNIAKIDTLYNGLSFAIKNDLFDIVVNKSTEINTIIIDIKYNFDFDFELDSTYDINLLIDNIVAVNNCIYYIAISESPMSFVRGKRISELWSIAQHMIIELYRRFVYDND